MRVWGRPGPALGQRAGTTGTGHDPNPSPRAPSRRTQLALTAWGEEPTRLRREGAPAAARGVAWWSDGSHVAKDLDTHKKTDASRSIGWKAVGAGECVESGASAAAPSRASRLTRHFTARALWSLRSLERIKQAPTSDVGYLPLFSGALLPRHRQRERPPLPSSARSPTPSPHPPTLLAFTALTAILGHRPQSHISSVRAETRSQLAPSTYHCLNTQGTRWASVGWTDGRMGGWVGE